MSTVEFEDDGELKNSGLEKLIQTLIERDSEGSSLLINLSSKNYQCLLYAVPFFTTNEGAKNKDNKLRTDVDYLLITESGFFSCRFPEEIISTEARKSLENTDRSEFDIDDYVSLDLQRFSKYIAFSSKARKPVKMSCEKLNSAVGSVPSIQANTGIGAGFWGEIVKVRYNGTNTGIINLNTGQMADRVREKIIQIFAVLDKKRVANVLFEEELITKLPEGLLDKPKNDSELN